jgi:hypothetical protein
MYNVDEGHNMQVLGNGSKIKVRKRLFKRLRELDSIDSYKNVVYAPCTSLNVTTSADAYITKEDRIYG